MKMFLSGCCLLLASVGSIFGATQSVTNTNDSGAGSLRAAITNAASGDTITFALPKPSTITLTSTELLINKSLTITGPGADVLTVRRQFGNAVQFRLFHISAGNFTVQLSGLTLFDGDDNDFGSLGGGGLLNESTKPVAISSCTFDGNDSSTAGGAICHAGTGTLLVTDCSMTANFAGSGEGGGALAVVGSGSVNVLRCSMVSNQSYGYGGGIYNKGTLVLTDTTLDQNQVQEENTNSPGGDGGGIYNRSTITVQNCTLSDNGTTAGNGGGMFNSGTATLVNCTLTGNAAQYSGGGLYNEAAATVTDCTITLNIVLASVSDGGGGLAVPGLFSGAVTTLKNTIVAGDTSSPNTDVSGKFTSQGYNIIGDGTGGMFSATTGDQVGTANSPIDPMLNALDNNGGPTQTCALRPGSPAIDKGAKVAGLTTDQRGEPRPVDDTLIPAAPGGNNSDIGAFEAQLSQSLNISTRGQVLTGDNILDGGFIITGTMAKKVLIRGIGPSLTQAGVSGALANPTLELHGMSSTKPLATNDNWQDTQKADIQATGIAPTNNLESAILATLQPGSYTAILSGKNGGTGIGVVEVYDLDQLSNSTLANISTRGLVGTGADVLIGGFILGPNGGVPRRILARATGPSLAAAHVADPLQDPELELHDSNGAIVAFNDNWKDTQQAQIQATGVAPKNDKEPAILATLAAGSYTAIVRGVNMTTGVALVEIYNLP